MSIRVTSIPPDKDDSEYEPPELPLDVLSRADAICVEFEENWGTSLAKSIEVNLSGKQGDERTFLLFHLMLVELEILAREGSETAQSDYEARFPDDRELVKHAFREHRRSVDELAASKETVPNFDRDTDTNISPICCPYCQQEVDSERIDVAIVNCEKCARKFVILTSPGQICHPPTIPIQIKQYEITKILGHGAFGVVCQASDPKLHRTVALKFPRIRGSFILPRFRREAIAVAQLNHSNIVQIHSIDEFGQVPFIVCVYVDGESLADRLDSGVPVDPHEAAELIQPIAEALQYAHDNGIIHRDVKPANILIDRKSDTPFLTDFGLARLERREVTDVTLTRADQMMGTYAYMSPEQANSNHDEVNARSDIFSLGIVLYEVITGQRPFRGSPAQILSQILNDPPATPRSVIRIIPRDLETICLKCLEKEPQNRYQSAAELARDLQRFRNRKPILSRRASLLERGWRWCWRNPLAVILSLGLALMVIFQVHTHIKLLSKDLQNITNIARIYYEQAFVSVDEDPFRLPLDALEGKSSDPEFALKNMWKYGSTDQEPWEPFVSGCLDHWSPTVREKAVDAISRIIFVDSSIVRKLEQIRDHSWNDSLKEKARIALENIRKNNPDYSDK